MNTAIEVTGLVAWWIGITLAVALAWALLCAGWSKLMDVRDDRLRHSRARDLGNELLSATWWFEDESVQTAIRLIGESLSRHGCFDIGRVRQQWRDAARVAAKPAEETQ